MRTLAGCVLVIQCAASTQAQELSWAEKMFDKRTHDFGVVARGADTRYRFVVTNLYRDSVHISDVRTTCGCTAAKPTKHSLASRESAHIEVTMNTRKFMRRKDSNLIVTFDQPQYAEVRIPLTAYIRTDVVLSPGGVKFGAVDHGTESRRTIKIDYAGRSDWSIRDVRSRNKHVTYRLTEKQRSTGRVTYELEALLDASAPAGDFRDQMILVTDDANNPHVPVLVEGRVEADFTITPAVVSLGTLVPGQQKTVSVVLRGKKPFAIEKVECESSQEAFKIRLPKNVRQVHVVPITVTPPDVAGKFSELFLVTIAGRAEPITFRAYGRIATTTAGN
jgi:hypothetical protein